MRLWSDQKKIKQLKVEGNTFPSWRRKWWSPTSYTKKKLYGQQARSNYYFVSYGITIQLSLPRCSWSRHCIGSQKEPATQLVLRLDMALLTTAIMLSPTTRYICSQAWPAACFRTKICASSGQSGGRKLGPIIEAVVGELGQTALYGIVTHYAPEVYK